MIELLQHSRWVRMLCSLKEQFDTIPVFYPVSAVVYLLTGDQLYWSRESCSQQFHVSLYLLLCRGGCSTAKHWLAEHFWHRTLLPSNGNLRMRRGREFSHFLWEWAPAAGGSRSDIDSPGGAHRISNPHTTNHRTASQCPPALSALDSSNQGWNVKTKLFYLWVPGVAKGTPKLTSLYPP